MFHVYRTETLFVKTVIEWNYLEAGYRSCWHRDSSHCARQYMSNGISSPCIVCKEAVTRCYWTMPLSLRCINAVTSPTQYTAEEAQNKLFEPNIIHAISHTVKCVSHCEVWDKTSQNLAHLKANSHKIFKSHRILRPSYSTFLSFFLSVCLRDGP